MKKLLITVLFLASCGGGSKNSVPNECTNYCIDLCNKMLVCGFLPYGSSCDDTRISRCEDSYSNGQANECNQSRALAIGLSCWQLKQL